MDNPMSHNSDHYAKQASSSSFASIENRPLIESFKKPLAIIDEDDNDSTNSKSYFIQQVNTEAFAVIEQEVELNNYLKDNKAAKYSWIVLFLILFIYLGNQWQRFCLGPAYGFKGSLDPFYNIKTATHIDDVEYSVLAGPAFTLLYAVLLLFTGFLADRTNRKILLASACIGWSVCTGLQSLAGNFTELLFPRLGLGMFQAAMGPPAYSLISDYFPPQQRTTANSVYSLGIYFGQAASSLTTLMIVAIGWANSFLVIGGIGVLFGVFGLVFIQEPKRGRFQINMGNEGQQQQQQQQQTLTEQKSLLKKYFEGLIEIFKNPTARWILLGGCLRFWQGYTVGFFAQKRFDDIYPELEDQFSILNALSVLIGGFCSNFISGIISDKYDEKSAKTKPLVCIIGSLLVIPTSAACFLTNNNFAVSMTFLFLEYLLGEGWTSPAISMIQSVIPAEVKGVAIAVFLFCVTIAGTVATLVVGAILEGLDAKNNPYTYGLIITANTVIPCILAVFCFARAGKHYVDFKKCLYYCKESNLDGIDIEDYRDYQVMERKEGSVILKMRKRGFAMKVERLLNDSELRKTQERLSFQHRSVSEIEVKPNDRLYSKDSPQVYSINEQSFIKDFDK